MNFTREPIILSVITPKEGCKLVLRNSQIERQEDYFVDAIEVISFEGAIFYRSLERPKSFILPVDCYEVLEVKETRMVLKSSVEEKSIKIAGGPKPLEEKKSEKLRDKKRSKRRKPSSFPEQEVEAVKKEEGGSAAIDEAPQVSSSVLKKIFPPPNTLIKEKLARYKNEEFFEENILPLMVEETKEKVDEEKNVLPEKPIEEEKPNESPSEKITKSEMEKLPPDVIESDNNDNNDPSDELEKEND